MRLGGVVEAPRESRGSVPSVPTSVPISIPISVPHQRVLLPHQRHAPAFSPAYPPAPPPEYLLASRTSVPNCVPDQRPTPPTNVPHQRTHQRPATASRSSVPYLHPAPASRTSVPTSVPHQCTHSKPFLCVLDLFQSSPKPTSSPPSQIQKTSPNRSKTDPKPVQDQPQPTPDLGFSHLMIADR